MVDRSFSRDIYGILYRRRLKMSNERRTAATDLSIFELKFCPKVPRAGGGGGIRKATLYKGKHSIRQPKPSLSRISMLRGLIEGVSLNEAN